MNISHKKSQGIGMTSQRTRDRLIARLREQGVGDDRVLDAISCVPRHLFVDEALSHRAYEDTALPIGYSQTISQPYIVAKMTQCLLANGAPKSVLEIGTGCGYQTAILASIFSQVYSVERIEALHKQAKQRLSDLEFHNIQLRYTDGNFGWPVPSYQFDCILMTAACSELPQALTQQLVNGGIMLFPFDDGNEQTLVQVTKTPEGIVSETLEIVSFVPLLSGLS